MYICDIAFTVHCISMNINDSLLIHMTSGSVVFDKRDYLLFFRNLTMGLALLVVPFLPASNIFFTVGFVVAERVLYLSSIGSCLITVLGFAALSKKYFGKKVSRMMYTSIYSLVTLQRHAGLKLRLLTCTFMLFRCHALYSNVA